MPDTLGDVIDQIVAIPMRVGKESIERERLTHYYQVARERQGDRSLTMQAARRIVETVKPGDWVFLSTGIAQVPWWMAGEMDGPPGLVSLARALAYGIGAYPVYLAEPITLPTCVAPSKAAGVPVHDAELIEKFGIWRAAAAIPMPLGEEGARETALELLDRFKPSAIIACEKNGPNAEGEFSGQDGHNPNAISDCVAPILFDEARERGILTIGIGDGGNELGLGVLEDVANQYNGPTPFRKGGSGTRVKADVGIIATVSNWGAYGVAAGIAYLTGKLEALQDAEMEKAILDACASEGSVDFTAGVPINHADGKPLEVNQSIVTLLRYVVESRLKDRGPRFVPDRFTEKAYQYAEYYQAQQKSRQ